MLATPEDAAVGVIEAILADEHSTLSGRGSASGR